MTPSDRLAAAVQRIVEGLVTVIRGDPPIPPQVDDPFLDWLHEQGAASRRATYHDRQNFIEEEFERECES